ncbi:MAG: TRAP transporter large permease, partial [Candidatus Adiutrix sp.]|nr:TRAP transporter large permease [Candidatus Adiutrix sp.]
MAFILFGSFLGLMFLGAPIAAALGLGLMLCSITSDSFSLAYLGRSTILALDSFPILAIPMFIFAGEIMGQGGISKRLFNFANACVGGITGGVAIATVFTCMLFGAISGSGPATFAAVGTLMIPLMGKQGYDKSFVTGLTAASGGLGVLIPPSLPMVMYGITAGVSIGAMFLAGVIPGIISGLALMLYSYFHCKKHPLKETEDASSRMGIGASVIDGFWALLSPVIIMGGIYGGLVTPTEAAAVSVVYGLIVGKYIYKTLQWKQLPRMLLSTASINAPILLVVSTATVLGKILSMQKIPTALAAYVLGISDNPIVLLLLMNLLLLFAGMMMETLASIIILTPMLLPIAAGIGVDPVHFGVIMVANLAIGFVTPPIGVSLYTAASITKLPF